MFSPFENLEVQRWFRQFDSTLRRLPTEEQTRQREEVLQHLEGLAAAQEALGQSPEAAWKAALVQFGDPTQIGRKLCQEWRQGQTGFRADMSAIFFGVGLLLLELVIFTVIVNVQILWLNSHVANTPLHLNNSRTFIRWLNWGTGIAIYGLVGLKYPYQAIKGAFFANLFGIIFGNMMVFCLMATQHKINFPPPTIILVSVPGWAFAHATIAYLASVTKRGWYQPSLADFKITSPRKRLQIGKSS